MRKHTKTPNQEGRLAREEKGGSRTDVFRMWKCQKTLPHSENIRALSGARALPPPAAPGVPPHTGQAQAAEANMVGVATCRPSLRPPLPRPRHARAPRAHAPPRSSWEPPLPPPDADDDTRRALLSFVQSIEANYVEHFAVAAPPDVVDALQQTVGGLVGTLPPSAFRVTVSVCGEQRETEANAGRRGGQRNRGAAALSFWARGEHKKHSPFLSPRPPSQRLRVPPKMLASCCKPPCSPAT